MAIKTETVQGQKSLSVTPKGQRVLDGDPVGTHHNSYTLNTAPCGTWGQNVSELDKPKFEQALQTSRPTP